MTNFDGVSVLSAENRHMHNGLQCRQMPSVNAASLKSVVIHPSK